VPIQLLHESIYQTVLDQLVEVYKQVSIGDPLEKGTLLGPLHTTASKESFLKGIQTIRSQVNTYIVQIDAATAFLNDFYLHLLSLSKSI
jgi:acyl-CoA reductase-like NAD-dependent aldehyde dehydrogenase